MQGCLVPTGKKQNLVKNEVCKGVFSNIVSSRVYTRVYSGTPGYTTLDCSVHTRVCTRVPRDTLLRRIGTR